MGGTPPIVRKHDRHGGCGSLEDANADQDTTLLHRFWRRVVCPKPYFFNRQNATSGQNPCVFTCILKDRPFYHWFFMVFAKYGLLGSIQGFPQDSQVRQRSSERPLWPSGPKVIPPWAQSCRGEFFGRVWTKTNDILPNV